MTTVFKTEKQIKEYVRRMLKARQIYYFMPQGGLYGNAGVPDFICCFNGRFVAIEAKSPQRKEKGLTALQRKHAQEIMGSDGKHFVVYDSTTLNELREWLEGEL